MNSTSLSNDLNRVKLVRALNLMEYLACVALLIFLQKTLIWYKITFHGSNSLNLAELLVNQLTKSISKKIYEYSLFYLIYPCLL